VAISVVAIAVPVGTAAAILLNSLQAKARSFASIDPKTVTFP